MSEPRHDHNGECLRCDEPWGSCTCGCSCRPLSAYAKKKNYHRRKDLKRLQDRAESLPLVITDEGDKYAVWTAAAEVGKIPLAAGRYEVVYSYLNGWRDAIDANGGQYSSVHGSRP